MGVELQAADQSDGACAVIPAAAASVCICESVCSSLKGGIWTPSLNRRGPSAGRPCFIFPPISMCFLPNGSRGVEPPDDGRRQWQQ